MSHSVFTTIICAVISMTSCVRGQSHNMRANTFEEELLSVKNYGVPPATATLPLYECTESHRMHPDTPEMFQVYHNNQWWTQECQENLVWNQSRCRCEYPDGLKPLVQCRDYQPSSDDIPGKYEQSVNGKWVVRDCSLAVAGLVWDQEACQCVWGPNSKEMITGEGNTPCDVMLNMTFEDGIKDESKGSFLEVARGSQVATPSIPNQEGQDLTGSKAAHFKNTALNVWYFAGNEIGSSLRVEFRFKMTSDSPNKDNYQIIMSNGCNMSSPGYTTPSIAIGYRAADQSYLLAFETSSARKAIVCTKQLGAYNWHSLSLIYEDGTLLMRIDGHPCIISQDFKGAVQKTPCPLTIGADPLERQSMYMGYLDDLVIARYCRRFIDRDIDNVVDPDQGPMPVVNVGDVMRTHTNRRERSSGLTSINHGASRSNTAQSRRSNKSRRTMSRASNHSQYQISKAKSVEYETEDNDDSGKYVKEDETSSVHDTESIDEGNNNADLEMSHSSENNDLEEDRHSETIPETDNSDSQPSDDENASGEDKMSRYHWLWQSDRADKSVRIDSEPHPPNGDRKRRKLWRVVQKEHWYDKKVASEDIEDKGTSSKSGQSAGKRDEFSNSKEENAVFERKDRTEKKYLTEDNEDGKISNMLTDYDELESAMIDPINLEPEEVNSQKSGHRVHEDRPESVRNQGEQKPLSLFEGEKNRIDRGSWIRMQRKEEEKEKKQKEPIEEEVIKKDDEMTMNESNESDSEKPAAWKRKFSDSSNTKDDLSEEPDSLQSEYERYLIKQYPPYNGLKFEKMYGKFMSKPLSENSNNELRSGPMNDVTSADTEEGVDLGNDVIDTGEENSENILDEMQSIKKESDRMTTWQSKEESRPTSRNRDRRGRAKNRRHSPVTWTQQLFSRY